jgi:hypothetical protein
LVNLFDQDVTIDGVLEHENEETDSYGGGTFFVEKNENNEIEKEGDLSILLGLREPVSPILQAL